MIGKLKLWTGGLCEPQPGSQRYALARIGDWCWNIADSLSLVYALAGKR